MSLSQVSDCLSCCDEVSLGLLLPHLAGVIVEAAEVTGARVRTGRGAQHSAWSNGCRSSRVTRVQFGVASQRGQLVSDLMRSAER